MARPGYSSLVKKGGDIEKRASLAHLPIFLWQDGWDRNAVYSEVERSVVAEMARKTNTMALDLKKDFIYMSNQGSYRFSKRVAEQCAVYVRRAFLQKSFNSHVARLSPKWQKEKEKLMEKFPTLAKDKAHAGVLYGNMAKAIQAFRTNIRSEGETKHTGYVVGIPMTLGALDPVLPGKKAKSNAKFFLKNRSAAKDRGKSKRKKVFLSDKLSWFEHGSERKGRSGQPERRIYSMAINEFLVTMGFIVGEKVLTRGTKKAKTTKNSKAVRVIKEEVFDRQNMLRDIVEKRNKLKLKK